MIGKLVSAFVLAFLLRPETGAGRSLQPTVLRNLQLARQCAQLGQDDTALAHAAVVTPDHPLRIRIDCSDVGKGNRLRYGAAMKGAIAMWEGALGGKIFDVTESQSADIFVLFQPEVTSAGVAVCGHSSWKKGVLDAATVVFTADVKIRSMRPDGSPMTMDQLRACAAHELGHILGLEDSEHVGDVMGKMDFSHPVTSIRTDEIEGLIRARNEAAEIRRVLTSKVKGVIFDPHSLGR